MPTASKRKDSKPMWVDMSVWGDGYWQHDGDITECDGCAFGWQRGAGARQGTTRSSSR